MTADPTALTIREMKEGDIEPLASAFRYPTYWVESRFRGQQEGTREVLVAELDSAAIGCVSTNHDEMVLDLLHLFALDVGPDFQSRGIGTALIEAVEHQAADRGLGGVWLDVAIENMDARRLYERLGYHTEGLPVVNRWIHVDGSGIQRNRVQTCHRMFKRFSR